MDTCFIRGQGCKCWSGQPKLILFSDFIRQSLSFTFNVVFAGVKVQKTKKVEAVDIRAPLIISNAGVANTFTKLLPKHLASRCSMWFSVLLIPPVNGN